MPLVMSLSAWGRTLSVDAKLHAGEPLLQRERDRLWSNRATALLALGIGLSMTTAGYFKLKSDWLSLEQSSTLGHAAMNYLDGRAALLTPAVFRWIPAWQWELMDWMTVAFELGFGAAMIWRRAFEAFLVVAVFFHVGVVLLFGIHFHANLIAYAAFVNWVTVGAVLSRAWDFRGRERSFWWGWKWVAGVLALGLGGFAVISGESIRGHTNNLLRIGLVFVPSVLIALGWVALRVTAVVKAAGARRTAA